jgi:hypothetical protein
MTSRTLIAVPAGGDGLQMVLMGEGAALGDELPPLLFVLYCCADTAPTDSACCCCCR